MRLYRISLPAIPPNDDPRDDCAFTITNYFQDLLGDGYGAVQQGNTSNYYSIKSLDLNLDPIFDPFEAIGMVCRIFR